VSSRATIRARSVDLRLTIWDLDREFLTGSLGEAIGEGAPQPVATLREILETLRRTYCGKVGIEYMNIQHPEENAGCSSAWSRTRTTSRSKGPARIEILKHLVEGEEFEHFLHARFVGQKRFALEGAENRHRHTRRAARPRRRARTCTRSSSAWRIAAG
jgi:2-oxoglutarate dehydrogenase E1 component